MEGPNSEAGVLCTHCKHINPKTVRKCERCGSHLYITCRVCHSKSPRNVVVCPHCGQKLHRTFWGRIWRKLAPRNQAVKPIYFILGIIAFGLLAWFVVKLISSLPTEPVITNPNQ